MKKIIICLAIILAACSCEKLSTEIGSGTCTIENAVNPDRFTQIYDSEELESVSSKIIVDETANNDDYNIELVDKKTYPLNYGEKITIDLNERTKYVSVGLAITIKGYDSCIDIVTFTDYIKVTRNMNIVLNDKTLDFNGIY